MSRRIFLTPDEEHDLIIQAQAGDATARDRVIANIMPLIYRQAMKIANHNYHVDPDDLAQEAVEQIVSKFAFFNPARRVRFITYFHHIINNAMLLATKQNGILKSIGQRSSKVPATSAARIKHAGPVRSLNVPALGDDRDVNDLLPDLRERTALDVAHHLDLIQAVRDCIERIPEKWRQLMRWRYIDDLKLSQIAVKVGMTRERIRQILIEAMRWLKQILLTSPLVCEYVTDYGDPRTAAEAARSRPPKRRGAAASRRG